MIGVRRKKLLAYGLPILLALSAGDHVYGLITRRGAAPGGKSGMELSVRAEKGAAGHNTIGIDEQALGSGANNQFLHFSTLGEWAFDIDSRPPCPKPIRALGGRRLDCVGFMYPLQTGDRIKDFCLLRSTQTCCYGPRPQFNQYILVEMKEPVKFQRLSPVMVSGKFFVEPKPEDGYIYRMECDSLANVGDDTPDIDPVSSAKKAKLPLFDYAPLLAMAKRPRPDAVPKSLLAMDGKRIVVAGYCVGRDTSQPPHIIVAKAWWDGVGQGTRPTLYNAVAVIPTDASQLPPLWKPFQVFTGELKVTTDRSRWGKDGIVQIRNAQLGVPGVTQPVRAARGGPLAPLAYELTALGVFLLLTLGWRKAKTPEEP